MKTLFEASRRLPTFSTLAAPLWLGPLAAHAEDYTYITNNGTITITGYTGPGGAVVIPSNITDLPVNSIGNSAFASCTSLTGITIPDSVTSIGMYAFSRCYSLASVALPIGVSFIDWYAFRYCTSLTNITIPNSLPSLPYMGFYYCTSLTSITIPRSVTFIDWYSFRDCTNLTSVYFQGNAPTLGSDVFLGDNKVTVYYLAATSGWSSTLGGRPALPWNPQVQTDDGSFGVQTNCFGFTISGTPNIPVAVEACTDLAGSNWTPLGSCTLTNGSVYFSDLGWTNHPARFYRVRSP